MRAKDYAKLYNDNPSDKVLVDIVLQFIKEIGIIAKERHATSNEAIIAIYDEQCRKWKAFARLIKTVEIKENGFEVMILQHMPGFYTDIQNYKLAKQFVDVIHGNLIYHD